MKFWELTSAFRSESNILLQVLKQEKWAKYYDNYIRLWQLVQERRRDILDEELPFELCYEVAEKSQKEYWLSFSEQPNVLYNYEPDIKNLERLLPHEILVRFGGNKIEEAHESAYTNVYPRTLEGNVEVIGSYNLTSIGLVAILRTETDKLPDNCNLLNTNDAKRWQVIGVFSPLYLDPYTAYKKLEAQKKQNIWHYLLKSSDKPKPGELLKPLKM